jgi:hypothetical protein
MSKSYYIPRSEADFNTWTNVLIAYLIANSVNIRKTVKEYLTNNHLVTDADRNNMSLPIYKDC